MTLSVAAFLILGLVVMIWGADFLVKGASRLATSVGISPLVVGLTVVAFGTSAPELAVSVMSAFKGESDIALGNVVGSNLCNVLFILGISALIVPLVVAQQLVRFDVPVMIGLSILVLPMGMDGKIGRLDGAILFTFAIAYTVFLVRQSRKETSEEVKSEYDAEYGGKPAYGLAKNVGFIIVGLVFLVLGSKWLVSSAVAIAQAFHVSELVIGLTIVALGTSMPEVATSIVAALKGERDIAVGNVVGSNIFNLVSVLGLSSLVAPAGIEVSDAALRFDIPVMIAVAVACLPIFFTGYRISRLNGAAFLFFYAAYLVYLILTATQHEAVGTLRVAMLYFILPITALTLIVITVREVTLKKKSLS